MRVMVLFMKYFLCLKAKEGRTIVAYNRYEGYYPKLTDIAVDYTNTAPVSTGG